MGLGNLALAAGAIVFIAFMFVGKIDKKADYETQATNLEIGQMVDTVKMESAAIRTGVSKVSDPEAEARMAERDKELYEIKAKGKKDRLKDDKRVADTEKIADDLDAEEAKKAGKIDPLDAFARSR